jgi:hypothetical protein
MSLGMLCSLIVVGHEQVQKFMLPDLVNLTAASGITVKYRSVSEKLPPRMTATTPADKRLLPRLP